MCIPRSRRSCGSPGPSSEVWFAEVCSETATVRNTVGRPSSNYTGYFLSNSAIGSKTEIRHPNTPNLILGSVLRDSLGVDSMFQLPHIDSTPTESTYKRSLWAKVCVKGRADRVCSQYLRYFDATCGTYQFSCGLRSLCRGAPWATSKYLSPSAVRISLCGL